MQMEDKNHWQGHTVNLLIQLKSEAISEIQKSLIIVEEKIDISVERSMPRSFDC